MAVPSELFTQGDVYIDYPQEEVLFRFDHATGLVYRKFYWDHTEDAVPHTSSLFAESRSCGVVIARERYVSMK